jgi:hypothetical protein
MDDTKTPPNQGVLVGLSDVMLGALKLRVTKEDMKLDSLKLTGNGTPATSVNAVALYDTEGHQLTNSVSMTSTATIGVEDITVDGGIVFPKDTYKTILIKGRVSATTSASYYLTIAGGDLSLRGVDSDANVTNTAQIALYSDATYQGKYDFSALVLEMKKNTNSPSGSVSRGSNQVYAIWDIYNPTGQNATITAITFTSKTGLPSGASSTSAYKLYDELGNQVLSSTTTVSTTAGTVKFEGSLSVGPGVTKTISLKIDTTNSAIWPSGTYLYWSVLSAAHVTMTDGKVGYAGTVWSIPADANQVTIY